jgi:hypothetical protein
MGNGVVNCLYDEKMVRNVQMKNRMNHEPNYGSKRHVFVIALAYE